MLLNNLIILHLNAEINLNLINSENKNMFMLFSVSFCQVPTKPPYYVKYSYSDTQTSIIKTIQDVG